MHESLVAHSSNTPIVEAFIEISGQFLFMPIFHFSLYYRDFSTITNFLCFLSAYFLYFRNIFQGVVFKPYKSTGGVSIIIFMNTFSIIILFQFAN